MLLFGATQEEETRQQFENEKEIVSEHREKLKQIIRQFKSDKSILTIFLTLPPNYELFVWLTIIIVGFKKYSH